MHFYLPRRHRRPLLFPPGLLALAGLLWLGCVALGPWQERLKLKSVMQLTMSALQSAVPAVLLSDSIPPPPPPDYLTRVELNKMLPWRDGYFDGNSPIDRNERIWIASAVHSMMSNTKIVSGVRIQFMPNSRYKDLVYVLNLMNEENVRKWFLDIRQEPVILYAYTKRNDSRELLESEEDSFFYEYGNLYVTSKNINPDYTSHSYLIRFDDWITTLWNPKLTIKSNYSYLYGTRYNNVIFGPERLYLSALNHYLAEILIPFKKWEWSVPLCLVSIIATSNIMRLKRRPQLAH